VFDVPGLSRLEGSRVLFDASVFIDIPLHEDTHQRAKDKEIGAIKLDGIDTREWAECGPELSQLTVAMIRFYGCGKNHLPVAVTETALKLIVTEWTELFLCKTGTKFYSFLAAIVTDARVRSSFS
jgi:hypothetical protein